MKKKKLRPPGNPAGYSKPARTVPAADTVPVRNPPQPRTTATTNNTATTQTHPTQPCKAGFPAERAHCAPSLAPALPALTGGHLSFSHRVIPGLPASTQLPPRGDPTRATQANTVTSRARRTNRDARSPSAGPVRHIGRPSIWNGAGCCWAVPRDDLRDAPLPPGSAKRVPFSPVLTAGLCCSTWVSVP